ncbi:MAG: DUF1538 domain-containing protein [Clostridium sp.]|nr:DUF1538 domain-containing protein [Clostridium sp.]MCM1172212.1 DUF1538 domain-containing protein [Clostridium sp.]
MKRHNIIKEKMKESVSSVLPIACIVLVLCLFVVPISSGLVLSFLIGTAMIIVGMCLFTIGADLSMTQIGSHIGAKMTNTRKLWFIMLLSFVLGIVITVAEPDLQVLAANVPEIDTKVLVATVSVGVGFFLMVSMLRILFGIPMKWLLLGLYGIVFLLAYLSDENFLSVAFDSGGVTTGPMTVPFIMSMGVGVASIRSDEKAKSDSFGLIALCSIGPILAVLILGFIYNNNTSEASAMLVNEFAVSVDIGKGYLAAFPDYFYEVVVALFPIFVFFLIFQIFSLKLEKRPFKKIVVGIVFTYIGLVLFLTGVNVGFSSLGYVLGGALVEKNMTWMIVPLAMVMGWFIINAEPAVHVLNKQVAELSAGAISEKTMGRTLSIAVSIAMGIAMIRVLTGIPIIWFVLIGYIIALLLAFFVPATFTAIAFDAGGVASGPMAATFMLPFAMGICNVIGGNVMTDAFGLVAIVAMMPLITVQIMGAISTLKSTEKAAALDFVSAYGDDETIELWEVS